MEGLDLFLPFFEDLSVKPAKIKDPNKERISSGICDLDMIAGGFKKGNFNLFEVEHSVDMKYLRIHAQIAWNAIMNNRSVIIIPSIGEIYPSKLSKEVVLHRPSTDDFESEIKTLKEIAEKSSILGILRTV